MAVFAHRRLHLLVLALIMVSQLAGAQPCIDYSSHMRIVSEAASPPDGHELIDISNHGNYVAILYGDYPTGRLSFHDGSDPHNLVELSSFAVVPGLYDDYGYDRVLFLGDQVYLFYHEDFFSSGGFDVYNCDPHGTLEFVETFITGTSVDLQVEGDRLYVLNPAGSTGPPQSGLMIYNIADPAAPVLLGSELFPPEYGYAKDLEVRGSKVFIAAISGGLIALDTSDPGNPVEIGHLTEPLDLLGIALAPGEDIAYITSTSWLDAGLVTIDITDPANMQILAGQRMPDARRLYTEGDRLFVVRHGSDWFGIFIYDIAVAESPTLLGKIGNIDSSSRLYLTSEVAYLLGFLDTLWVIGPVYGSPAPHRAQLPILDGLSKHVSVHGDLALVDSWWSGTSNIVDTGAPDSPQVIGELPYRCFDLASVGDIAYVLANGTVLRILDLADPASPMELAALPIGYGEAVDLAGQHLYIAGSGLKIINISDPESPMVVGSAPGTDFTDIAVHGDFAYISAEYPSASLRVLDVSDPGSPFVAGSIITASAQGLALDWPHLYLGQSNLIHEQLAVIDVSTPGDPEQVTTLTVPGGFYLTDLALLNDRLYVASRGGVSIVDIVNPLAPVLAGNIAIPDIDEDGFGGKTYDIALGESALLLAEGERGLGVAWLDCAGMTAVPAQAPAVGMSLALHPNPFNPQVSVEFILAEATVLQLEAFDVAGRRLARIAAGDYSAGRHQLSWTAENGEGKPLASGVYFIRLSTDRGEEVTAKAVLLR